MAKTKIDFEKLRQALDESSASAIPREHASAEADTDDEDLLEACPFCGYLLEGLPVAHACPECGQKFDRRWRLFGICSPWDHSKHALWLFASIGLVGLVLWLVLTWFHGQARESIVPALALPMVGLLGFWHYAVPPAAFVAVGPPGIVIVNRITGRMRPYPWSRVTGADAGWNGHLLLWVDGRKTKTVQWKEDGRELARCAEYIYAQLERRAGFVA